MGIVLTWLAWPGCARDVDANLPAEYARVTIPADVLASKEAIARGRAAFQEYCAICHGESGNGLGQRREGLTSAPRDFTDPTWRQSTSPRAVFYAIREGLAPTAMPSWKALSEQQAWELTAYVWSLGARP
jgi:high-affinity iron transporter